MYGLAELFQALKDILRNFMILLIGKLRINLTQNYLAENKILAKSAPFFILTQHGTFYDAYFSCAPHVD